MKERAKNLERIVRELEGTLPGQAFDLAVDRLDALFSKRVVIHQPPPTLALRA